MRGACLLWTALHIKALHVTDVYTVNLSGSRSPAISCMLSPGCLHLNRLTSCCGLCFKVLTPLASAMHRWIHRGADHEAPQVSTAAADSEKVDTVSAPGSSTHSDASFRGSTSGTSSLSEAALQCPTAAPQSEQSLQPAGSVSATADCHTAQDSLQCAAQVKFLQCSSSAADHRSGDSACANDSRTGKARSSACNARNSIEYAHSEAAATRIQKLFRDASVLVGMHPDQVGPLLRPRLVHLGCKHTLSSHWQECPEAGGPPQPQTVDGSFQCVTHFLAPLSGPDCSQAESAQLYERCRGCL